MTKKNNFRKKRKGNRKTKKTGGAHFAAVAVGFISDAWRAWMDRNQEKKLLTSPIIERDAEIKSIKGSDQISPFRSIIGSNKSTVQRMSVVADLSQPISMVFISSQNPLATIRGKIDDNIDPTNVPESELIVLRKIPGVLPDSYPPDGNILKKIPFNIVSQQTTWTNGSGGNNRVYIGDTVVIRFSSEEYQEDLETWTNWLTLALEGIIPKIYFMGYIRIPDPRPHRDFLYYLCIINQKGKTLESLGDTVNGEDLIEQMKQKFNRLYDLGIMCFDNKPKNCIFLDGEFYLIDVDGDWCSELFTANQVKVAKQLDVNWKSEFTLLNLMLLGAHFRVFYPGTTFGIELQTEVRKQLLDCDLTNLMDRFLMNPTLIEMCGHYFYRHILKKLYFKYYLKAYIPNGDMWYTFTYDQKIKQLFRWRGGTTNVYGVMEDFKKIWVGNDNGGSDKILNLFVQDRAKLNLCFFTLFVLDSIGIDYKNLGNNPDDKEFIEYFGDSFSGMIGSNIFDILFVINNYPDSSKSDVKKFLTSYKYAEESRRRSVRGSALKRPINYVLSAPTGKGFKKKKKRKEKKKKQTPQKKKKKKKKKKGSKFTNKIKS